MNRVSTIVKLTGPISVAHRSTKGLHICNALEFDIVGTGETKQAAFIELRELVGEYLLAIIEESNRGNKVRFFNPADSDDWNTASSIEYFDVTFELDVEHSFQKHEIGYKRIKELGPYRDSIGAVNLVPA